MTCKFYDYERDEKRGLSFFHCRSSKTKGKPLLFPPAKQCKGNFADCPFEQGVDSLTWFCPKCKNRLGIKRKSPYLTDEISVSHEVVSPDCKGKVFDFEIYYA